MSGKITGLGSRFFIGGYDLSGDVNALSGISTPLAVLDVTGINKLAHERLGALADGAMSFTTIFDVDAGQEQKVLSPMPRADTIGSFYAGAAIGNAAANINAKEVSYTPTRATDGMLSAATALTANGYGLEWGWQLTAGKRTDTAATNGTGYDAGDALATPAVPASTTPVTNASPLPATVVISGGTVTTILVNGVSAGSGDGTYTVPPGGTIAVTYSVAPTWTWTLAGAHGCQVYLQVFSFTGTDVDLVVQSSAANTFTSPQTEASYIVTSTPTAVRIPGSNSAVNRYWRINTTTSGGFSSLVFAASVVINAAAVSF